MKTSSQKVFFVTGTDTDVGKTTVMSLLCRDARIAGLSVGVMKPFASGSCRDAAKLKRASGSAQVISSITPFYFETPAAPWAAAKKEKRRIDLDKLDRAFRNLRGQFDVLLVEGIGGLLVPITGEFTVADLIRRWKVPAILVSRWGLGTLNHTLLCLEALERRNIPVAGIVLNQTRPRRMGFVERTNKAFFGLRNTPPVLATVRFSPEYSRRLAWEKGSRERLWGIPQAGSIKSSLVKIEK